MTTNAIVSPTVEPNEIDRQLPVGDEIFLDHVAHFVRDADAAREALTRCGFAPTPVSIQVNTDPSGRQSPTGTGNVTAMFERGYTEVLFKTADTPLAREFDAMLADHAGLHLAAFAVADAQAAHRRLAASGFRVRDLVNMSRPVDTEAGKGDGRIYNRSRRAGRDAGGPHSDADPSHRRGGVAEAVAQSSE